MCEKLCIVACMPTSGKLFPGAAKAFFVEMAKDLPARGITILRVDPQPSSNLALSFNQYLCFALNRRKEGVTHFAMLHDDIEPDPWWLDTLFIEMERTGAHMISAVSPIKSGKGVTSTAIGKGNSWNPWARLTMKEVHQLPETFTIDDLGDEAFHLGYHLLLNTGCMLIDLRPAYWDQVGDRGELVPHFDIDNRIVFIPGKGWEAQTDTEDWKISRILSGLGAKLAATRKVGIKHFGPIPFNSNLPWGEWDQDQAGMRAAERAVEQQGKPLAIHEHGYWLEDLPDGAIRDPGFEQFLVKYCKDADLSVVDLGCGRGWYTKALNDGGVYINGLDGNPNVEELGNYFFKEDLTEPIDNSNQKWLRDLVLCIEVGEHIPEQYSTQFLDNVCDCARKQVIISWALPGQPGHGHVNCKTNEWVEEQMTIRGFRRNPVVEELMRSMISLPYLQRTLMVYDRKTFEQITDEFEDTLKDWKPPLTEDQKANEEKNDRLLNKIGEDLYSNQFKPSRRFLVYMACDGEYRAELFGEDRLFDVAINCWSGKIVAGPAPEFAFQSPHEKYWSAYYQLNGIWEKYEAVAFLDDDIGLTTKQINQLFVSGVGLGCKMWQPALTDRSVNCWPHLAAQPNSFVRKGRFCELMATFFSREGLEKCFPTFVMNQSSWGLHMVWPIRLGREGIAIFDGIQADHLRPLKQPIGGRVMPNGKTQRQEHEEMLSQCLPFFLDNPGYFDLP